MKKIGLTALTAVSTLALPLFAFAQAQGAQAQANFGGIGQYATTISTFINSTLIPLIFGIALLVFIWGIFMYFILGGGDEGKREEGKQLMIYGIAGFVVMVSVWGIVNLIASGLGFSSQDSIQNIPNVPTSNT